MRTSSGSTQLVDRRSVALELRELIETRFPGRKVGDSTDLFGGGFGSSLLLLEIAEFLEGRFGLLFRDDCLTEDNFRSIDRIASEVDNAMARYLA